MSSTASLGFRIEGVHLHDDEAAASAHDWKSLRKRDDVMGAFCGYLRSHSRAMAFREQLTQLRSALDASEWFRQHECVGSSLLFVYDAEDAGGISPRGGGSSSPRGGPPPGPRLRMIDFAKTVPVDAGHSLDHRRAWELGNREDGYLAGVDSLIEVLDEIEW